MLADLTKMLQSAAKGKAPVVAIPIEGHAPLCLNRKRLAAWIKGVQVETAEYVEGRGLKITGRAGTVKTTCTLFAIARNAALVDIRNWADKERAKNLKVIAQGAIGAAAIKAARKIENAKLKAAKLAEIEQGGSPELEDAKRHVANILSTARVHGRGVMRNIDKWEAERIAEQMPETVIRHVAHHAVPHRVRKTAAVIVWRLKALRTAWFEVTKYNPGRRKTTKKKLLKVKKAIQVIQIVKDATALRTKLESISPARIPNPRFAHYADRDDMHWTAIDPLGRPKQDRREYYQPNYDRAALAERLREARQTIKVLTPPPDNVLEMPEAEEFAQAA